MDTRRKIAVVQQYLSGSGNCITIAKANGMDETTVKGWIRRYLEQGSAGFVERTGNRHYGKELKTMCVKSVLSGKKSVDDIVAKYNKQISKVSSTVEKGVEVSLGREIWWKGGCAPTFSHVNAVKRRNCLTSGQNQHFIGGTSILPDSFNCLTVSNELP